MMSQSSLEVPFVVDLVEHPGGKKVLLKACGKDSSKQFDQFHSASVLEEWGPKLKVGVIGSAAPAAKASAKNDFKAVEKDIALLIKSKKEWDDGSLGPLFVTHGNFS